MDDAADRVHEPTVGVRKIGQRRQPPRDGHVPQEHLVAAVLAGREVLRHAFRPPERQTGLPEARVAAEGLRGQAELKDVHQLVPDGVAEFGVAAAER